MDGKFGVENLKKVLDIVLEGGNVAEDIAKEEGNTMAKIGHVTQMFDELMALTGVDFSLLDDEIKELGDVDRAELLAHMKSKFDLENDVLELKIEEGLSLAKEASDFVLKVISYVKALKGD